MRLELPRDGLNAEAQYNEIKAAILRQDLPNILGQEQKRGFPKEYTLLMKQRGSEARRKLSTLSPAFFKIGTELSPTTFTFVSGANWAQVAEAAEYAIGVFKRHAPFRTGRYINSLSVQGQGRGISQRGIKKATEKFTEKDRLYIGPTVIYSASLEAGHFTGYYKNAKRGGILYHVAKEVNVKYGVTVACRMIYTILVGGKMAMPVLEFGVAGAFASNSTRPGKNRRRRKAAARRRG
jgi:hypothetical protein